MAIWLLLATPLHDRVSARSTASLCMCTNAHLKVMSQPAKNFVATRQIAEVKPPLAIPNCIIMKYTRLS